MKSTNPSKLVGIPMISSRDESENIQTEYFVNFIWYGLMSMKITILFSLIVWPFENFSGEVRHFVDFHQ